MKITHKITFVIVFFMTVCSTTTVLAQEENQQPFSLKNDTLAFAVTANEQQPKMVVLEKFKRTESWKPFEKLKVSNAISVYLSQDTKQQFIISASNESTLKNVEIKYEGTTLSIGLVNCINCGNVKVLISADKLQKLKVSGASSVDFLMPFTADKFAIEVSGASKVETMLLSASEVELENSGASKIETEINTQRVAVSCSGASKIKMKGKCTNIKVQCSGASKVMAKDLLAAVAEVNTSGASKACLNVSKEMELDASGASQILYKGGATIKKQSNTGASSIKPI